MMRLTEKQIIAALRRLEKGWNPDYMLFSWSNTLKLLRIDKIPEGARRLPNGQWRSVGTYEDAVVESFIGIKSDGGDPE